MGFSTQEHWNGLPCPPPGDLVNLGIGHGGISETFTVRKMSFGVGVEKTFPIHSPKVADITVTRRGKVRRAKLYYLRERTGKAAKVKEIK